MIETYDIFINPTPTFLPQTTTFWTSSLISISLFFYHFSRYITWVRNSPHLNILFFQRLGGRITNKFYILFMGLFLYLFLVKILFISLIVQKLRQHAQAWQLKMGVSCIFGRHSKYIVQNYDNIVVCRVFFTDLNFFFYYLLTRQYHNMKDKDIKLKLMNFTHVMIIDKIL